MGRDCDRFDDALENGSYLNHEPRESAALFHTMGARRQVAHVEALLARD
jgi:hypothetical protein